MNTTNTKSHPNNPYCPHYISHLIEEYTYGKEYPSLVTRPANNYIHSVKSYGWEDTEFVNGYQTIKWTRLIVKHNNSIQAIWNFRTVQTSYGKIGYIVDSWKNQFDRQVSKEDGNIAYLMILQNAKKIDGAEVIEETLIK